MQKSQSFAPFKLLAVGANARLITMVDVLAQNASLKKDMADLLTIVNKLREENETYRQNFENV